MTLAQLTLANELQAKIRFFKKKRGDYYEEFKAASQRLDKLREGLLFHGHVLKLVKILDERIQRLDSIIESYEKKFFQL